MRAGPVNFAQSVMTAAASNGGRTFSTCNINGSLKTWAQKVWSWSGTSTQMPRGYVKMGQYRQNKYANLAGEKPGVLIWSSRFRQEHWLGTSTNEGNFVREAAGLVSFARHGVWSFVPENPVVNHQRVFDDSERHRATRRRTHTLLYCKSDTTACKSVVRTHRHAHIQC